MHTKGPWSLDGDLNAMNLDVIYGSGRIAMMECENDELSDVELMANARLIAAAPVLKSALRGIQRELHLWGDDTLATMNLAHHLAEIDRVLALAEG